MSKKARGAGAAPQDELEPLTGGPLDFALVIVAVLTVFLVAVWFKLDVNRVFDVPKALALKVGGCGIFLVWLLYGLFAKGFPWKSIRIFAGPVAALTLAVGISTALSIDVPMSLYGVYERQFGFQGFLACIGLFVVTATCIRSRRGAIAALSLLMITGGIVGSYSLLQATGVDPYGFFPKPHNKVYSTLGNATFAGNALALIFPMSLILAIVAIAKTCFSAERREEAAIRSPWPLLLAVIVGTKLILSFQLMSFGTQAMGPETRQAWFKAGVGVSLVLMILLGLSGSWGPSWARFESIKARRFADAFGAGGLFAASISIAIGLVCTRTRGAWVGTAVAVIAGLVLLPFLFRDHAKRFTTFAALCWGGLLLLIVSAVMFMVLLPNHLYTATVKSIPYAFSPEHTVYGKGQGTRRYLWSESPRVLKNHAATLDRKYRDLEEAAKIVKPGAIEGLDLEVYAPDASAQAFDKSWRSVLVWPFGIGIETYRYAFMSHKSKLLEALDPMTNHDNPHNNYLYTLASFGFVGLLAYLWLLWRLLSMSWFRFWGWKHKIAVVEGSESGVDTLEARALAFGVLTSFFSYAFYSIAGFDSVACAVFLYFFLGCAAAYFSPSHDEPRRNIIVNVLRRIAEIKGRDPNTVPNTPHMGASLAVAGVAGILLVHSIAGALTVHAAERAFVGERKRDMRQKIEDIKRAIQLNPYESFYKQNLGSTLADVSRSYQQYAARYEQAGKTAEARGALISADQFAKQAEVALYAALDHAWAPENVFISAFQLYYSNQELDKAEYALERALEHSPHLGAVRANLAVLKLERRGYKEALADCKWVLEVDPNSAIALRTCGRASYFTGDLGKAQEYLNRALAIAPKDSVVKTYLSDLARAKEKAATSTVQTPG